MKPAIAALGIGIIILGFFALTRVLWLGWLEIAVGVLAVLTVAGRIPRSSEYGGFVFSIATLLLWIAALANGVVGWLSWLTFLFGLAFVLVGRPKSSSPEHGSTRARSSR